MAFQVRDIAGSCNFLRFPCTPERATRSRGAALARSMHILRVLTPRVTQLTCDSGGPS